ncbi:MAG: HEAT repeat domain-containing protein [Desulfobacteraceae bacterium]|nr:HEAT repeat domain-containing protein [Desulfobacteraceae bacterium]
MLYNPNVISSLNNNDPVLRSRICWILGTIGNPEAVKPLISTLEDSDRNVRNDAVTALGKIGDPIALKPFLNHMAVPG